MTLDAADFPLLTGVRAAATSEPNSSFIADAILHPTTDPFLASHQYKGTPILPAAAILELFAQATLATGTEQRVAGFSAVRFHNGLRFFNQRPEPVRIVVAPLGPSRLTCQLRHDFRNSQGVLMDADRLYATGIVELEKQPSEPFAVVPLPERSDLQPVCYADEARMWFGSGMRCLQSLQFEGSLGTAEIIADSLVGLGGRSGNRWCLSPAVFDAALVGCAVFTSETTARLQMPNEMDAVRLGPRFARPGERCQLAYRFLGLQLGRSVFEWSLFGDDGTVLCAATGYRCDLVAGKPGECLLGAKL